MNRNFIFVSLLATLSTVNTIPHQLYNRTNTFGPCSKAPPETVLLNVVLSPDPVIAGKNDTFTIDAKFNVEVTTSTKYTECPVLPGTEMTAKVPVPVPATLPKTNYNFKVSIVNLSNNDFQY
uniref:Phosphatidylglycerol/phosphatidylinositol transfer protein n=1 Tax=Rhizophagus irregularis (strain DAOM 181602 / DAOM 197198 / MUCL 43194) TaxID=747089 RepID=U9UJ63_RHIID